MSVRTLDAFPEHDDEVPAFLDELGLPGIVDIHVHAMPERLQAAVWRFFDGLDDPPWPIRYRDEADARLRRLRELGVVQHTALAYAHKPGMLGWLNDHTLGLAEAHAQVVPTFTLFPEDGVSEQTAAAIERGGQVVKVHLQVGRFHATDPRLDESWEMVAARRLPVVLHASAVYGVDGGGEYCGPDEVADLLDRHPDLVLVVAHLGRPDDVGFLRLAEQTPGLHLDPSMALVDTDGIPGPYDHAERLAALWPRVVFGSDFPTVPHDYVAQVRGLGLLGVGDDALRAMLHDTARTLLSRVD